MGAHPTPPEAARHAETLAASGLQAWQLRCTLALMDAALAHHGALEPLLARHPALQATLDDAAAAGLADLTLAEALARLDERLAAAAPGPLARLQQALGLGREGLACFVVAALPDTDPALGAVIDELHGSSGRPTRATFARLAGAAPAAAALQALRAAGALVDSGRGWAVPPDLWDLACGLPPAPGRWQHRPHATLVPLDALVLPPALRRRLQAELADAGPDTAWLLRAGPGSGRHALAGALAQARGQGLLEAAEPAALGAAAALLGALPLVTLEPAPGEALAWSPPAGVDGPLALRLPRHGTVVVAGRDARHLELDAPDAAERAQHWRLARPGAEPDERLVAWRLPRATLHRAARRLPADDHAALAAFAAEVEALGRHALDGLAQRVPAAGAGEALALPPLAAAEFEALVARCRHRDRLAAALPAAFGQATGVRALFKGPSGTGKTLAARHLAARLGRPLYRVDLAAAVSKYIGETERNLERVFAAAESLDIVLLLDEGDALLAGRTGVANATDRYANLETNFLLQRLEAYAGVLLITTNAADRIDGAFARRLDVTVEFPLPDAATRLDLWQAHLGPGHALADAWLERVARRCALAGGQIRNAALHATLLAIDRGASVGRGELAAALEREYRKAGQQCPSLADEG